MFNRFQTIAFFLMTSLVSANALAWTASLAYYKAPEHLDASWTPQWSHLLFYYPLDNSFSDASGKGNNGTAVNSPSFSSSTVKVGGYSAYFNGNTSAVVGNNVLTATYTKMAWIQIAPGNTGYSDNIISGSGASQHAFWTNGCGPLQLSGGHNNGWGAVCDSTPLSTGVWYHVAITYDSVSQVMNLYKNGALVSTASSVAPFAGGSGYTELAGYDGNGNNFWGYIDEAAAWSVALQQSDIQLIYQRQLIRH